MYLQHFKFNNPPFKSVISETGTMRVAYHQDVYSLFAQQTMQPGILGLFSREDELLSAFCQGLHRNHPSALSINALPKLSADALLYKLLPVCADIKKPLHAVEAIVQQWRHEGVKHKLLIISAGQAMRDSGWTALSMLLARAQELNQPLTVLVTGTPEVEKQFDSRSDLASLMHTRHSLRRLTSRESRDYIEQQTVDAEHPPFSSARIKKMHALSQGYCSHINQLAHLSLLACWTERAAAVSRRHLRLAASEIALPRRKRKGFAAAALLTLMTCAISGWYLPTSLTQQLPVPLPVPTSWKQPVQPQPIAQRLTIDNEVVSQPDAMHQLYQMWGYDASAEDALCPNAGKVQMKCEQGHDTLVALTQQGYPWVSELQFGSHLSYAVVAHVGSDSLDLLINNQTWQVTRHWYEQHASGNYTLLHKLTPDGKENISAASSEKDIHWLDASLSEALALPATHASGWSAEMVKRTREYQQKSGIHVDGLAGKDTLIHLMRTTNSVPAVGAVANAQAQGGKS